MFSFFFQYFIRQMLLFWIRDLLPLWRIVSSSTWTSFNMPIMLIKSPHSVRMCFTVCSTWYAAHPCPFICPNYKKKCMSIAETSLEQCNLFFSGLSVSWFPPVGLTSKRMSYIYCYFNVAAIFLEELANFRSVRYIACQTLHWRLSLVPTWLPSSSIDSPNFHMA